MHVGLGGQCTAVLELAVACAVCMTVLTCSCVDPFLLCWTARVTTHWPPTALVYFIAIEACPARTGQYTVGSCRAGMASATLATL
jgi:hypothetical protein